MLLLVLSVHNCVLLLAGLLKTLGTDFMGILGRGRHGTGIKVAMKPSQRVSGGAEEQ